MFAYRPVLREDGILTEPPFPEYLFLQSIAILIALKQCVSQPHSELAFGERERSYLSDPLEAPSRRLTALPTQAYHGWRFVGIASGLVRSTLYAEELHIMTRSIVLTIKGRVGKSTSATNIAVGWSTSATRRGSQSACAADRHRQPGTRFARHTPGVRTSALEQPVRVLMADRQDAPRFFQSVIVQSEWDADLHVLPGSALLEGAERELNGVAGAPYRAPIPCRGSPVTMLHRHRHHRPSFSLLTEMACWQLLMPSSREPLSGNCWPAVGYQQESTTSGRLATSQPARERHSVTETGYRIKGHNQMLDELKSTVFLGQLVCGVIPQNEAVSYSHIIT